MAKPKSQPPKERHMTPSTAVTNETAATWYSYYSQENDREYYYEPVSGAVSWVAPTCYPTAAPILTETEEDVIPGGARSQDEAREISTATTTITGGTSHSLALKLLCWGLLLLIASLGLQAWMRWSLPNSPAPIERGIQSIVPEEELLLVREEGTTRTASVTPVHCRKCLSSLEASELSFDAVPLATIEEVVDPPIAPACEPVPCETVPCQAVPCAAVPCEPVLEYVYQCLPQTPWHRFNFDLRPPASRQVQVALNQTQAEFARVWQRVQEAAPAMRDGDDDNNKGEQEQPTVETAMTESKVAAPQPKLCRLPLARRMVPECRDVVLDSTGAE
jgi:hypothetical protein